MTAVERGMLELKERESAKVVSGEDLFKNRKENKNTKLNKEICRN